MPKLPDWKRILYYLKDRGDKEVNINTLIRGQFYGTKRIIEYTGRISDARKKLGCTCGENTETCKADEHIISTRRNFVKYTSGRGKTIGNLTNPQSPRPEPSLDVMKLSKDKALKRTQKRISKNPDDPFYQKLLNWQQSMEVDPLEEQVAQGLL